MRSRPPTKSWVRASGRALFVVMTSFPNASCCLHNIEISYLGGYSWAKMMNRAGSHAFAKIR